MTKLALDIQAFATYLANELTKYIELLPTAAGLMRLAANEIKKALFDDDSLGALCLQPECPGHHINSEKEEELIVPRTRSLGILASHHIAHTHSMR